jgi:hypothetical protein
VLWVFVAQQVVAIALATAGGIWQAAEWDDGRWPLGPREHSDAVTGLRLYVTYFLLLNTFIPISLWVTIEFVRFGQALFMQWDAQMRVPLDPHDPVRKHRYHTKRGMVRAVSRPSPSSRFLLTRGAPRRWRRPRT